MLLERLVVLCSFVQQSLFLPFEVVIDRVGRLARTVLQGDSLSVELRLEVGDHRSLICVGLLGSNQRRLAGLKVFLELDDKILLPPPVSLHELDLLFGLDTGVLELGVALVRYIELSSVLYRRVHQNFYQAQIEQN